MKKDDFPYFIWLVICLSILPFFGFTQDNSMSIGVFGTVKSYNHHLNGIGDGFDSGRSYEKIFNGDIGISVGFKLKERITFRSGLAFSRKGYKIKSQYISMDPYIYWLAGEVNEEDNSVAIKMDYLEIPIQGLYYFTLNKPVRFYGAFGFATNAKLSNIYNDTDVGNTLEKDAPGFVFLASLGVGLEFYLNDSVCFVLEPNYNHYFSEIDATTMESNTQSFGLLFGLKFGI